MIVKTKMDSKAIANARSQLVWKLALNTPTQATNAMISAQMYAPEPTTLPSNIPTMNRVLA